MGPEAPVAGSLGSGGSKAHTMHSAVAIYGRHHSGTPIYGLALQLAELLVVVTSL